ncbi:MAG: pseudouridine synthase [Candidatus Neomarinimicrobiota bacterium]|nr:pseudouridine synthase [Candidatus Neomarinimicrobiota bacterium]
MRLNKYISLSGVSSRREAEELIKSATITVNDKVEMDPGYRVSPGDKIKYDEKIIAPQGNNQVVMLNKPAGFITTVKDPLNRKTVMDLVQTNERLFPIGRLDKDTTGLLLLTNNGSLANFLMHPKNKISRVYKVEIDKILNDAEIRRIASKIYIGQKEWGKAEVLLQKKDRGRVILHLRLFQGKKREIRRIFYRLKRELFSLQRIKFGPIELNNLPLGQWRILNSFEYKSLNSIIPSNFK